MHFKVAIALSILLIQPASAAVSKHCRATSQEVKLDPSFQPSITIDGDARTGQPSALSWQIAKGSEATDAFLVLGFPGTSRFRGDGFIALPPAARAPRSIRAQEDKTRVIVPLSGQLQNPKGTADIMFFDAGTTEITWTIVGLPSDAAPAACVEHIHARGSLRVRVTSGSPQFVAQDRFAVGAPKSTFVSNDAKFALLVFQDRYQIIAEGTGDLIMERAGTKPRFSPSSRYLTAQGGSGRLEVLDLLAQRVVFATDSILEGNFGGVAVAGWVNGDTLLVLGYGRKGGVQVTLPLIDGRDIFSGEGCNACHAFGSTSVWIDLDQFAFAADDPNFSLLEVADSQGTIKFWDEQKPEDRGPPPRRPKYPMLNFDDLGTVGDKLGTPKTRDEEEFVWEFSDKVTFVFSDVWNGDLKKLRALLASRTQEPNVRAPQIESKVATHGKISKRMVEVAGKQVSPRNNVERLAAALLPFNIRIDETLPKEPYRPIARTNNNEDKVQASAEAILKTAMAALAKNRPPLLFRGQASKDNYKSVFFAKSYSADLGACTHYEGPEADDQSGAADSEAETPPVISAEQLIALWKFELSFGTLVIAQQYTQCGTAPDRYGDLIAVFSPADPSLPTKYTRIAAAYSDAGESSDPTGIDKERANSGSALRLDFQPTLQMNLINQRWLIVTSKDGGTAIVFEIPTMKRTYFVANLENPLDIASISTTTDHRTLVQLNNSGAIGFFNLETGKVRLRGKFVDEELVLLDSALHFEATPEGASYVYVQVPGNSQLFTLDQFSSKLELSGVGQKRIYQDGSIPDPPVALTPPSLAVEKAGPSFVVTAASESALSELRVMVDGFPAKITKLEGAASRQVLTSDSLGPGRWASFSVTDAQNIKSVTKSFRLGNKPYPGTLRVISIGINKFNGGKYQTKVVSDLAFAANDAKRFEAGAKKLLSGSYGGYASQVLATEGVNRNQLVEAVRDYSRATKRGDTLVLFVASHGSTNGTEFSLLLPSPSKGADVVELPFSVLSDIVRASQGRVFIFLDACHSADATQDAASELLATTNPNITVISASKGKQSSLENQSWGGGIFTTALLEVLSASKSSRSADNTLSLESLYANVRKIVASRTNGRQTPWFRRASWQGEQSID